MFGDDNLVEFLTGAMEELESWTCTDREFLDAVERLSENLEGRATQGGNGGSGAIVHDDEDLDALIRITAYMRAPPSIRLLHLAGRIQPGLGGDLMDRSVKHVGSGSKESAMDLCAVSQVVIDRITILARAECYSRVFGPKHRADVLELLENLKGKPAPDAEPEDEEF